MILGSGLALLLPHRGSDGAGAEADDLKPWERAFDAWGACQVVQPGPVPWFGLGDS